MIPLKAHYDGKVLVPDEPVSLMPNQKVLLQIQPIDVPVKMPGKRAFVTQPGLFVDVGSDFDAPLGDDFWGFGDNK